MANYLFDSDVIIWCLRGHQASLAFLQSIAQESWPACSALSVLDVKVGIKKGEEKATERLLDALRIIPVTKEIAHRAAFYIRFYRGMKLGTVDALIAATCFQENLILVTCNLKHYPMPELIKISPLESSV